MRNNSIYLTVLLLALALFVRIYRLDQLLGFYFDQGRDALVIWRFWHEGNLFLVGPTTGIEGILRGPWYYWLIAPFYLIGGGSPVLPTVFLAFLSVLAIFLLYKLAVKMGGQSAGLLSVFIAGFSFFFVLASRWLANPTPMLLISMLLVWSMFQVMEGKKWAWVLIAFLLGMAMQFGSAAEIFYFPAVGIFAFWQRKNLPDKKVFIISALALFVTFMPQIIFDIRHKGVLLSAIGRFLFEQESFRASFWDVLQSRVAFYYQVFFQKLFPISSRYWSPALTLGVFAFLVNAGNFLRDDKFRVLLLVFIAPLVGMLFFQGNQGYIFDYYFTGYYLVFVLLFSVLLAGLIKRFVGFVLVVIFVIYFSQDNLPLLIRNYIMAGTESPISLGNQLQAVDWVFEDAKSRGEFNVDVYVPPVIPYAYDYLFLWQASSRCGKDLCGKREEQVNLLYTLYEVDLPHPERLESWLARQKGIGQVEESIKFGGITVERRMRLTMKQ